LSGVGQGSASFRSGFFLAGAGAGACVFCKGAGAAKAIVRSSTAVRTGGIVAELAALCGFFAFCGFCGFDGFDGFWAPAALTRR
jgi:hypothetical protein